MYIKIAERLHPFSHTPGTYCILPRSTLRLQIFPARLIVHDLSESVPKLLAEVAVPIKGSVKEFTVELDLEKGNIHVWGKDKQGYFRYRILPSQHPLQITLQIEKGLSSWNASSGEASCNIQFTAPTKPSLPILLDRLSFGNHKSQDWDRVKRRGDLTEILPAWLRLGQLVPLPKNVSYEGTAALLNVCKNATKMEAYSSFENLFNAAFEGLLSPRLADEQHQGFELTAAPRDLSPLVILTEGAKIIRSFFIHYERNDIFVLPHLPPQFHYGRFLQVQCGSLGDLDFEWTKKMIRRMVFHAKTEETIKFHFPKEIQRYRLNGKIYPVETAVDVQKGQMYAFDRFQK